MQMAIIPHPVTQSGEGKADTVKMSLRDYASRGECSAAETVTLMWERDKSGKFAGTVVIPPVFGVANAGGIARILSAIANIETKNGAKTANDPEALIKVFFKQAGRHCVLASDGTLKRAIEVKDDEAPRWEAHDAAGQSLCVVAARKEDAAKKSAGETMTARIVNGDMEAPEFAEWIINGMPVRKIATNNGTLTVIPLSVYAPL